jgi:transposase-like protein
MPLAGHPFSLCRPALLARLVWLGRGHEGDHHCCPQFTDCVRMVHFQRNVLSHVPASSMSEVAEDLKAIFKVRKEKTAQALVKEFISLYQKSYPKAVSVFEMGIEDALSYLSFPGSHHARIRSTNMLERLFKEIKRRTRVVGVFPNETSASTLATEIALRSSEEWALRRYLTMDALEAKNRTHNFRDIDRYRPCPDRDMPAAYVCG